MDLFIPKFDTTYRRAADRTEWQRIYSGRDRKWIFRAGVRRKLRLLRLRTVNYTGWDSLEGRPVAGERRDRIGRRC